jgi:hypothetical protein
MTNETAFHESGHAVFANIFKDYLYVHEITILPSEYGKGVNVIRTIKSEESPLDRFHFIIVILAGLVVQVSKDCRHDHGIYKKVLSYLDKRLLTDNQIKDSFDGDFQNLQESLNNLSLDLEKPKNQILASAMVYIANCLIKTNQFWPAIDALAFELTQSKILKREEIDKIFNAIGFNDYLIKSRQAFLIESEVLLYEQD